MTENTCEGSTTIWNLNYMRCSSSATPGTRVPKIRRDITVQDARLQKVDKDNKIHHSRDYPSQVRLPVIK
jgi:hypothetical protein